MSEYKNGDTVRVVLEGTVVDLYSDNRGAVVFDIESEPSKRRGLYIDISNEAVRSVEVLASPLKVGDTVEGKQYNILPVGTVVNGKYGPLWKLSDGSWSTAAGDFYPSGSINMSRTIKYLPE